MAVCNEWPVGVRDRLNALLLLRPYKKCTEMNLQCLSHATAGSFISWVDEKFLSAHWCTILSSTTTHSLPFQDSVWCAALPVTCNLPGPSKAAECLLAVATAPSQSFVWNKKRILGSLDGSTSRTADTTSFVPSVPTEKLSSHPRNWIQSCWSCLQKTISSPSLLLPPSTQSLSAILNGRCSRRTTDYTTLAADGMTWTGRILLPTITSSVSHWKHLHP